MSAAPDYHGWPNGAAPDLAALLAAAGTAVENLIDGADLGQMADRDAAAVMGTLTALVGRLDGLRVQVAREVRDRDICCLRGTRTLTGWLHADARLADDAVKLSRLAVMGPDLPRIAGLLAAGTTSLSQAATACWQISQLPHLPVPPDTTSPPDAGEPGADDAHAGARDDTGQPGPHEGGDASGPQDRGSEPGPDGDANGLGTGDGAPDDPRDGDAPDRSDPGGAAAEEPSGGGDAWAGLWRAGDVHAAADELFAQVLPGLDSDQLRQLGAHLREAADSQEHAGDDQDDYARRGLRISRSLGGAGEISGRLHAEAAEQVIAAFEQLGAKTGPGDRRTKAQRWADALARLTATTPDLRPGPAAPAAPAGQAADANPDDDQPCDADTSSGHDHHAEGWHDSTHRGSDDHVNRGPDGPRATNDDHISQGHGSTTGRGDAEDQGNDTQPRSPAGTIPAAYQRPRIIVTVSLSTLLGQPLAPGATLGSGTPLTAEAARRLACDAEVIRLITGPAGPLGGDHSGNATAWLTERLAAAIAQLPPPLATPSAVLDIGRKSPGWTPRQRDALYVQYGGHCGFGRCGGPIDVIHHIIHWLYGGKTRIINGFPCCKYHHWLLHEGGWRIKKHGNGEISLYPPPPGWRPGTIYRRGKPVTE